MKTALICGAGKGIGFALLQEVLKKDYDYILATHRNSDQLQKLAADFPERIHLHHLDANQHDSFASLSKRLAELDSLDLCINSIGVLSNNKTFPEKQISEITPESALSAYQINVLPTLFIAQSIKRLLRKTNHPIFASLSAKVGSVSDNKMGGWYSYRISKAALNMALKNISIEFKRVNKNSLVVGIHPGTTKTDLSRPFLENAAKKYKIHEPQDSAKNILKVLDTLSPAQSGGLFSWTGEEIAP